MNTPQQTAVSAHNFITSSLTRYPNYYREESADTFLQEFNDDCLIFIDEMIRRGRINSYCRDSIKTLAPLTIRSDFHNLTPLSVAVECDFEILVKELLWQDAAPNLPNCYDEDDVPIITSYPLTIAVQRGNTQMVKLLLSHGARLLCNRAQQNPLHIAASKGNLQLFQILLHHAKNNDILCATCENGRNVMHYAVASGSEELVALINGFGYKLDKPDVYGIRPSQIVIQTKTFFSGLPLETHHLTLLLASAIIQGDEAEAIGILAHHPTVGLISNIFGDSGLSLAIARGCMKVYRKIIDNADAADVVTASDLEFHNIMHLAATNNRAEILHELVELGCPVDIRDEDGCTPLHVASFHGNMVCLSALRNLGADMTAVDNSGQTVLHYAVMGGHADAVEYWLHETNNALATTDDIHGVTPLMLAFKMGKTHLYDSLVGLPYQLYCLDARGRCAAHYLIMGDDAQALLAFMNEDKGVIRLRDCDNRNLLHYAVQYNARACFREIMQATQGSLLYEVDNFGLNPMFHAIACGQYESVFRCLQHSGDHACRTTHGECFIDFLVLYRHRFSQRDFNKLHQLLLEPDSELVRRLESLSLQLSIGGCSRSEGTSPHVLCEGVSRI